MLILPKPLMLFKYTPYIHLRVLRGSWWTL